MRNPEDGTYREMGFEGVIETPFEGDKNSAGGPNDYQDKPRQSKEAKDVKDREPSGTRELDL